MKLSSFAFRCERSRERRNVTSIVQRSKRYGNDKSRNSLYQSSAFAVNTTRIYKMPSRWYFGEAFLSRIVQETKRNKLFAEKILRTSISSFSRLYKKILRAIADGNQLRSWISGTVSEVGLLKPGVSHCFSSLSREIYRNKTLTRLSQINSWRELILRRSRSAFEKHRLPRVNE